MLCCLLPSAASPSTCTCSRQPASASYDRPATQLPHLAESDMHMPSTCWPSSAPTPFPRTLRKLRLDCSYEQQRAESATMERLVDSVAALPSLEDLTPRLRPWHAHFFASAFDRRSGRHAASAFLDFELAPSADDLASVRATVAPLSQIGRMEHLQLLQLAPGDMRRFLFQVEEYRRNHRLQDLGAIGEYDLSSLAVRQLNPTNFPALTSFRLPWSCCDFDSLGSFDFLAPLPGLKLMQNQSGFQVTTEGTQGWTEWNGRTLFVEAFEKGRLRNLTSLEILCARTLSPKDFHSILSGTPLLQCLTLSDVEVASFDFFASLPILATTLSFALPYDP